MILKLRPTDPLPLPVLCENGDIIIIEIPRMTATAFAFFKRQLDVYAPAIVIRSTGDSLPKSNEMTKDEPIEGEHDADNYQQNS